MQPHSRHSTTDRIGPHVGPIASAAKSPTGAYTFTIKPYELDRGMGQSGMYRVICEFEPYFNVQPLRANLGMLLAEKAKKAGNGGGDGGGGGGGAAPTADANEAALAHFRGGWNAGWVKKNTPMLPSVHSTGFRKGVGSGDRGGGSTEFRSAKPPPPGVRAKLAAAAEQRRLQQEEVDDAGTSRSYSNASSGCGAFGVNSSTGGVGRPAFGAGCAPVAVA